MSQYHDVGANTLHHNTKYNGQFKMLEGLLEVILWSTPQYEN